MERFGFSVNLKNKPALDPDFLPLYRWEQAYLAGAKEPIAVAVRRNDGKIAVAETFITTPRARARSIVKRWGTCTNPLLR